MLAREMFDLALKIVALLATANGCFRLGTDFGLRLSEVILLPHLHNSQVSVRAAGAFCGVFRYV